MKYLFDSDSIIDYLHNRTRPRAEMAQLRAAGIAVSVVSVAEIYEGAYAAREVDQGVAGIEDFLNDVTVLVVSVAISKVFAKERLRLRKLGTLISDLDLLIASTALHHGLVLVTSDKVFRRVDGLILKSVR